MAFDFKKEYKEFYMPKNKPEIVNVPKANYIAVRGKGNPNEEGGAYQQAIAKYCEDNGFSYEFTADDEVVIDGIKHEIYRGYESGSRGNYGIKCKEK